MRGEQKEEEYLVKAIAQSTMATMQKLDVLLVRQTPVAVKPATAVAHFKRDLRVSLSAGPERSKQQEN